MVETARIVGALAAASVRTFASTLTGNLLRTLGAGVLVISEALGALFLIDRVGTIGGWTAPEILLLVGVATIGLGLGLAVGAPLEPSSFSQLLRDGRFDAALTRPLSPWLWVTSTDVQIRSAGRALGGVVLLGYAVVRVDASVGVVDLALLAWASLLMGATVLALLTIGAAITMWTIEGTETMNVFTYGGAVLAGWPLQIYSSALRAVFVFAVPVGVAVYVPVLHVLDRQGPPGAGRELLAVTPLLVGAFALLASVAWRAGIRRYTGTGA